MQKKLNILCAAGLLSVATGVVAVPTINVDAPGNGETVTGIIQIYGWASDEAPMEDIMLQLDNDNPVTIGYGGSRTDVAAQRPNDDDADHSGFSTALNTHLLTNGMHKVTLSALNLAGEETSVSFDLMVFNPPGEGANRRDEVHLHDTTMNLHEGNMVLDSVMINGQTYSGVKLKLNRVTNGFLIAEITDMGMGGMNHGGDNDQGGMNHGGDNDQGGMNHGGDNDQGGMNHGGDNDQGSMGGMSGSEDPIVRGKAAYAQYGCAGSSCHTPDPAANQNNILKGSGHGAIMGALANVPQMADVAKQLGEDHRTMIDIADYIKSVKINLP